MQAHTVSFGSKQKPNLSPNPLKQLFSHNLSPKQKPSQLTRQKPIASGPVIELGDKYIYSHEDMIGDGFTSKVYKGYDKHHTNKSFAIKVIEKSRLTNDQMKLIRNEIQLHPKLDHKFIVKCYDVFDTPKFIHVVLQFCHNGDFAQYLEPFRNKGVSELRAIQLMEQIIQGCRYLVQQGILHRDLKPQNILRAGNTLKIADFGFAVKGKKTLIDSMNVGTPLYMPPQAIEESVYSHKSDFFALGCIMYQVLHGKTPWYKNDQKALAKIMRNAQIDLSKIKNANIRQFISKACEISQSHRMSIDEFMQFDFRKTQLVIELSPANSESHKNAKSKGQKTDRTVNQQQVTIFEETGAKSTRSKKSQTAMEATFVSTHVYFKSAKCEQIKKITAQFEEKFQLCLLLKYLIENSEDSILLEQFDKKNLKIVLFRHCIFIFKKLINDFAKNYDLKSWVEYKQGKQFEVFEEECKSIKEKIEKQFNLQLKGMSLKNLSQVNKRFPQLTIQYELPKTFFEKLKEYLREIIRKFHQQILKKMVQKCSALLNPLASNTNSNYFEAFKSLYRYHESCDQKLCEEDMKKSVACHTSFRNMSAVKMSSTKTSTTQNSSNVSSNLLTLNSARKDFYSSRPLMDQLSFGKKPFNHLSPEIEKISIMSPKSKYLLNKTAGKNYFSNQIAQDQTTSKPHHHNTYLISNLESETPTHTNLNNTMVSVYSPNKKLVLIREEKVQKVEKVEKSEKLQSVESHFSQVLCKNFAQSKTTREQFFAIKKKIKWLW